MERKNRMLRLDKDTDAWLEANVQGSINDWLVELIKREIQKELLGNSTVTVSVIDTKGFDKLLSWRMDWVDKVDGFVDLEKEYLEKCGGYEEADDDFYADKRIANLPEGIKQTLWNDYFGHLDVMNEAQHTAYAQAIIKQCKQHEQDLQKRVYKTLTVKMVLDKFAINEKITIDDIIDKFDCNYNVAWHNIKPCLESHGYKVVLGKNYHVEST
jgi:hypothetical protein